MVGMGIYVRRWARFQLGLDRGLVPLLVSC